MKIRPFRSLSICARTYSKHCIKFSACVIGINFACMLFLLSEHFHSRFLSNYSFNVISLFNQKFTLADNDNQLQLNQSILEDRRLYKILKDRATNLSNRYYLHDFEYFQMIHQEFPQTTSAHYLRHETKSMSLVLTEKLNSKDVLFIIMSSVKNIHKAKLQTETWLKWAYGNYFIFSDGENDAIPLITLPELFNKSKYSDAQHRQLIGSKWILKNKRKLVTQTKWFVFADDDTWINVPALLSYLKLFDYKLLLSIGYIWDNIWLEGWAYFSGGGGIILSRAAFMSIVPALYGKKCPFKGFNDVTIVGCLKEKGVTKIHSDRFSYEYLRLTTTKRFLMSTDYAAKVTLHYMNNPIAIKHITCTVAAFWKSPIKYCEHIQRNNLTNPYFRRPDALRLRNA